MTRQHTLSHKENKILHFTLHGLLREQDALAFNATLGMVTCLVFEDGRASIVAQQQFSASEVLVLLPLLNSYPYYCPYDVLLASFTYGKIDDETTERCRLQLQDSRDAGTWDNEIRPMRNMLSRTRFKTRAFNIEIASIHDTGYMLITLATRKRQN